MALTMIIGEVVSSERQSHGGELWCKYIQGVVPEEEQN